MNRKSRLSRGGKIAISVSAAVLCLLMGVGIYFWNVQRKYPVVSVKEVTMGTVTQILETTAPISSKRVSKFEILDGVKVLTVDVKVGDVVHEGDVLATFDVSTLSSTLEVKRLAYEKAASAFTEAEVGAVQAKEALPLIEKQIKELEEKIAAEEAAAATATSAAAGSTQSTTEATTTNRGVIDYIGSLFGAGDVSSAVNSLLNSGAAISQINELISKLNSLESLGSGDMSALLGSSFGSLDSKSQLVQLQAQRLIYMAKLTDTYLDTYSAAANSKYAEYKLYKSAYEAMSDGWKADCYGVVSAINITPDSIYTADKKSPMANLDITKLMSALSGDVDINDLIGMLIGTGAAANVGIELQDYSGFTATISLGKYDLASVKVGQKAKLSYLGHDYSGTITYVSATASESSSMDISSLVGSLTGGGGSSSAASAEISIDNPDENIVIGFDIDVAIETKRAENVKTVPVEAVRVVNNEKCVYVYNPNTKRLELRPVEIGLSEDSVYEIISGVEQGELVVRTITGSATAIVDGARVKLEEG